MISACLAQDWVLSSKLTKKFVLVGEKTIARGLFNLVFCAATWSTTTG